MAKPKKPSLLKKPRKPKKTLTAMENYLKRYGDVEKENKSRLTKYKAALSKWESLKDKIARM